MNSTYDVIVVGLGAMGSATAYHLAARGAKVLGIDQYEPPHTFGSSHGESRIIRQLYYEHPLYVPLVQRSFELWRKLEQDANAPGLLQMTGGLMVGPESGELITGVRRSSATHGLPLIDLDERALRAKFPNFPLPKGLSAVLDPEAGFLVPEACIAAHLALAVKHGATLQMGERVLDRTPSAGGIEVRTSRSTYSAGQIVVTAGAWISELLGDRGPRVTVERQTLLWFEPPGDAAAWSPKRFPVYMCEFDDGQMVYGFPLLKRGFKAAVHYQGEEVTDVREMRREISTADVARVQGAVARLFPWVKDAKVLDSGCCPYTDTADLQFTIDWLPGERRVLVSSPCSGHGFKFATAIGELQAQLLLDGKSDFDVTPFRIDR